MNAGRGQRLFVLICVLALVSVGTQSATIAAPVRPTFGLVRQLPGAGRSEPRVAIDRKGRRYVVANLANFGPVVVYRSTDRGRMWKRTPSDPSQFVIFGGPPNDIVTTRTGRVIVTTADSTTSFSDDGGATWTESRGTFTGDVARQFLAAGPKGRVYLIFHNSISQIVAHNLFVQTSTDNGATFGPPVPITMPGEQAYGDLQCAGSDGPSSLFVNQRTGRLYTTFGTRSGADAMGGCAAAAQGVQYGLVRANRVWVATSPDGSVGSWRSSLAVDQRSSGRTVTLFTAPGAVDAAGNVYVTYVESRSRDRFEGPVRYVHAPANLASWSRPVSVAPAVRPGHVLPHVVAGGRGRVAFAYLAGVRKPFRTSWYSTVSQTLNALSARPRFAHVRLSSDAAYTGGVDELVGHCGVGPAAQLEDAYLCDKVPWLYGIAVDSEGKLTVSWPSGTQGEPTYVATQLGGPKL